MTSMTQLAIESCLCSRKRSTVRLVRAQSCLANDVANHGVSFEVSPGADRVGVKANPEAAREGAARVAAGRAIRSKAYLLLRSYECFAVDDKHNLVPNARFGPHQSDIGESTFHAFTVEANFDNQQTIGI
jgi:hypothetical protein